MRTLALLLTLVTGHALAAEPTVLATGAWSEPVDGLRGRVVVALGKDLRGGGRESLLYVELEHAQGVHRNALAVLFDPAAVRWTLADADGKAVPTAAAFASGGRPGKTWLTLPYDSAARMRANPYGHGRAGGVFVMTDTTAWHLTAAGRYDLAATLTVAPPADRPDAWKGELRLPPARITVGDR